MLNTRSIVNKLSKFMSFVYSSNYSIVCCTETWLSDSIFDNEIIPTGYSIYRKDRGWRGGGVMVAVKNSICSAIVSSPPDLEVVTVSVGNKRVVLRYVPYTFLLMRAKYITHP